MDLKISEGDGLILGTLTAIHTWVVAFLSDQVLKAILLNAVTIEVILAVACFCFAFYRSWTRNYAFWRGKGVVAVEPKFHYGSVKSLITLKETESEFLENLNNFDLTAKIIGFYSPVSPMLLIRDPDIVKEVLCFKSDLFEESDLTRVEFTKFFEVIKCEEDTARKIYEDFLKSELLDIKRGQGAEINMISLVNRITLRVFLKWGFGLNSESLFESSLETKLCSSSWTTMKSLCLCFTSLFFKMKRVSSVSDLSEELYIKSRKGTLQQYKDIIEEKSLEAKLREVAPGFNKDEIEGALRSYFSLVERVSAVISWTLLELASHPTTQEKLKKEILSDQTAYFLTHCIQETLRLHPISPAVLRTTCDTVSLNDVSVPAGTKIVIPFKALCSDPIFHQNPSEFRPERFKNEEKLKGFFRDQISGCTVSKCLVKVGITTVLSNYRLELNPDQPADSSLKIFLI